MRERRPEDDLGEDTPSEAPGPRDDQNDWDSELRTEAEVTCPYCGESIAITLDAGGGTTQEYIEDCQVCCRPWHVHVRYDETGTAEVWVEESA